MRTVKDTTRRLGSKKYLIHLISKEHQIFGSDRTGTYRSTRAYTPDGALIGRLEVASFLAGRGIVPELISPDSEKCEIGYNNEQKRWYAWTDTTFASFGTREEAVTHVQG